MAITTRAGKGSALTHAELDANFTELGLSHGDTDIELSVDEVVVTGNVAEKTTTIGDFEIDTYAAHGFEVSAGDQAWATVTLKENSGSTGKPVENLANPTIGGEVSGGTVASPTALEADKRMLVLTGMGTLDASGTLPTHAQAQVKFETSEAQSSSACGSRIKFETSPNGRAENTIRTVTLQLQDNEITINTGGDGKIKSGGDLILDDAVVVEETLHVKSTSDFDGNVNMDGNLQLDGTFHVDGATTLDGATTAVNGVMSISDTGGLKISNITKATADYVASQGFVSAGGIALITDGARPNVPIFYDGTDWRYFSDSAVIAS
jgi:hypothetical protein